MSQGAGTGRATRLRRKRLVTPAVCNSRSQPCDCWRYGMTLHLFNPTPDDLAPYVGQYVLILHTGGVPGSTRGVLKGIKGGWISVYLGDEQRTTQIHRTQSIVTQKVGG